MRSTIMRRIANALLFLWLGSAGSCALAQQVFQLSQTAQNAGFGPVVASSDGKTALTGLITGTTLTSSMNGSNTTIVVSANPSVTKGQYITSLTGANGSTGYSYVQSQSGSGPYTITVSPAFPSSTASADTYNLANIGVQISKNSAAWATPSANLTETGLGWYSLTGNATDEGTLGLLNIHWDVYGGTAGVSNEKPYFVAAYNPLSGTNLGLSAVPTANPAANGGLPTIGTGAGQIGLNGAGGIQTTQTFNTTGSVGSVTGNIGGITGTTLPATVPSIGNITATYPTNFAALLISGGGLLTDTSGTTTLLTRIPGTVQPQTGDSYARLGAPAGANTSADIAAITGNILNATASSYNSAGTIGAKINAAGAASDPWATLLSGETVANSFGMLLKTAVPNVAFGTTGGLQLYGDTPGTTSLLSKIGTPANGSVSLDIAAVLTGITGIPAALKTTTINGHTFQDIMAMLGIDRAGTITSITKSSGSPWTITIVYSDGSATATYVSTFTDSTFTVQSGRSSVTFSGLP